MANAKSRGTCCSRWPTSLPVAFIMIAGTLLLSSTRILASSHPSISSWLPRPRPFLIAKKDMFVSEMHFPPRGGSEQMSDINTTSMEGEETVDTEELDDKDEAMCVGSEEEQEDDESESFDATRESEEDEDDWQEPVNRRQHEVDAESWFEEGSEEENKESVNVDLSSGATLEESDDDSDAVSEESFIDLSDEEDSAEERNDEDVPFAEVEVSRSSSPQQVVENLEMDEFVSEIAQPDNAESVNEVEPSEDDEGSSPSEIYPEEPDARLDPSIDVTKVESGSVFVSAEDEEVIAMTQHSTDDDSTAFVDRMELADAEDEGETTAGGYGDSYTIHEERQPEAVQANSPAASAPTVRESNGINPVRTSEADQTGKEEPEKEAAAEPPSRVPDEIDDSLRRILRKELRYHRYEVNRMKPGIAEVVAEKRIQRPAEGMPWNWYVEGYGPDRFQKAKKIAGTAAIVTLVGIVFVQNVGNVLSMFGLKKKKSQGALSDVNFSSPIDIAWTESK